MQTALLTTIILYEKEDPNEPREAFMLPISQPFHAEE